MRKMGGTIEFAYDVVCPYAYLASKQVEEAAARCRAKLVWTPVLLGGLYDASMAPQGKHGSATDVMPEVKRKILSWDLLVQVERLGVTLNYNSKHPVRSIAALRLLLSAKDHLRPLVTHELFKAYWVNNLDISNIEVLQMVGNQFNLSVDDALQSTEAKEQLHSNTERLSQMGAFGVPSFIVNGRLFYGQDRIFLMEWELGRATSAPSRLLRAPYNHRQHTLVFFFDFSSPWSFLASLQMKSITQDTGAKIVYRPFLLGAVFKAIGTPVVPLRAMPVAKAIYMGKDFNDWSNYLGIKSRWPSIFPIRSVLPLRVAICNANVIETIYHAAWVEDKEIAKRSILIEVLDKAGFDAEALLKQAETKVIKEKLKELTDEALSLGCCGAPTFQILDPEGQQVALIWGQDRLSLAADMLCGWRPKYQPTNFGPKDTSQPVNKPAVSKI